MFLPSPIVLYGYCRPERCKCQAQKLLFIAILFLVFVLIFIPVIVVRANYHTIPLFVLIWGVTPEYPLLNPILDLRLNLARHLLAQGEMCKKWHCLLKRTCSAG